MTPLRLGRLLVWLFISVGLLRLSVPPFDVGPLVLVAWVPFLWVTRQLGWRRACLLGFVHGFALGFSAHAWLVTAIELHGHLPTWQAVLVLAAVAGICGLRSALVGAAVAFCKARGVSSLLAFPVFLACAELLLPGLFPWTNALAVHTLPVWSQAAAWGGATLVSALLSLVNALVFRALSCWLQTRSLRAASAPFAQAAGVVIIVSVGGLAAIFRERARTATAPHLHLAVAHLISADDRLADLVPELRTIYAGSSGKERAE